MMLRKMPLMLSMAPATAKPNRTSQGVEQAGDRDRAPGHGSKDHRAAVMVVRPVHPEVSDAMSAPTVPVVEQSEHLRSLQHVLREDAGEPVASP